MHKRNFITNWFKNPVWSGRYINYEFHYLFRQDISLIKGLDRCIKLSGIRYRKKNLDQVEATFQLNNYPLLLIKIVIEGDNKLTVLKVTLPNVKCLSERLRRSVQKFNINFYFENNRALEKLLANQKDYG